MHRLDFMALYKYKLFRYYLVKSDLIRLSEPKKNYEKPHNCDHLHSKVTVLQEVREGRREGGREGGREGELAAEQKMQN